ncbi:unnamed protein product [Orchesella dallaii]|uniref:Transposable element P transposase n=1 Tax=Orchesella dallaii TaxID=48710 RepID=A0ABP1PUV5_9HEXA
MQRTTKMQLHCLISIVITNLSSSSKHQGIRSQKSNDNRRIQRLKASVTTLKMKLKERVDLKDVFSKNVTFRRLIEAQVERHKHRNRAYTDFEKTSSLSLYYSCGPTGYQTLMKMGLHLPNRSTLGRWTKQLPMFPGLNHRLLSCIQKIMEKFNDEDLDCLITWDEVGMKEFIEYNKFYDMFEGIIDFGEHGRTLEPANEALVFMIRGINSSWRFPISFYFSKGATPSEMLEKIVVDNIKAVQNIGLRVRLGVCDMSFTNQGLYRAWSITPSNPSKIFNDQQVYFIHDTPHLIKLVRNNLINHTFLVREKKKSKKVKWSHIRTFFEKDRRVSSRMAPRLSKSHIYLKDYSKMKVKLAAQVFSNSVYAGIATMCRLRILKKDFKDTADFLKKIDEIFDFLNMSSLRNDKFGRCAAFFYQKIGKLDDYFEFFESVSIPSMSREPEFLRGLKLTLRGIKHLAIDLYKEGYRHIYTRNLQQDCLENFFSLARSKGGHCRNPTARCFRTNFRFLFFATLIHSPTSGNTENCSEGSFQKYVENMQSFMASENRDSYEQKRKVIARPTDDIVEDNKVGLQSAAEFYSVNVVRKLKFGKEQESEVALYMGAACIKAITNMSSCETCEKMLVQRTEQITPEMGKYSLVDFKQYDRFSNGLAYLSKSESDLFQFVNSTFTKTTCQALNSGGTKVLSGVLDRFEKQLLVIGWLKEDCPDHRRQILQHFIRAKMYQLVKDKNDAIRQLRSWSQTRRDLRNQ